MNKFLKQKNKAFTRTPKFGVTPKGGGFTLVETLVAISIFTVSLLGIMSVLASGISNTGYAKDKMMAGYLAQEGIEYVRNMRDGYVLYGSGGNSIARWNQFKSHFASCNSESQLCDFSSGYDSSFIRKIWVTTGPGQNVVKIFSKVGWTQGSGNYSITFSENLFNWVE